MDARELNRTLDLPALLGWPGAGHKRWLKGPCPSCGGRDRFVLKRTGEGRLWYCRGCGDDRYHTALDFLMRRDNLTFKEALARHGGGARPWPCPTPPKAPPGAPTPPPWQMEGRALVERACAALTPDSPCGQYLLQRGLEPPTWAAWRLGACRVFDEVSECARPTILIPYLDSAGSEIIWAIRYRFIDGDRHRYTFRRGSVPALFGLHLCRRAPKRTLAVVEGEINAMSLWQCQQRQPQVAVDVVSPGSGALSELQKRALRALSMYYKRVVVWLDDPEKSLALQRELARPGLALSSPVRDGVKWDANEYLVRGALGARWRELLGVPCDDPGTLRDGEERLGSAAWHPSLGMSFPSAWATSGRCVRCGHDRWRFSAGRGRWLCLCCGEYPPFQYRPP